VTKLPIVIIFSLIDFGCEIFDPEPKIELIVEMTLWHSYRATKVTLLEPFYLFGKAK
jgi:hypothetical protein